jgi:hypothetical protein
MGVVEASPMQEDRERWMQLARLPRTLDAVGETAAGEKDPVKLMLLVTEINLLLEKKANRLNFPPPTQLREAKS